MNHPSRQAMMDKAIAERQRIRDWLLPHMKGGKPKAFTKDQYRLLAASELGAFSKAAFDHGWISAIEDSGRQDWYEPKPPRKATRQLFCFISNYTLITIFYGSCHKGSPPNINPTDEANAPLIYAAIIAKCSDDGHLTPDI